MLKALLTVCGLTTLALISDEQSERFPLDADLPTVIRYVQKSEPEDRFSDDQNESVAAAWRVATVGSPEGKLGPARVNRFLGLLEARLRVGVPMWWEAYLQSAVRGKSGVTFADVDDRRWVVRKGIALSGFCEATLSDGTLSLTTAGKTWALAGGLFEELAGLPEDIRGADPAIYIIGAASGEDLVLGFQSSGFLDGPGRLYCVRHGRVRWTARSPIGIRPGGYSGGYWGTFSEIVIRRKHVFIFGAHDEALYINAFEQASGKQSFRFATSFVR